MKITRIKVFQVDLPLHEGSYKWSGGKSVSVFDSTVVHYVVLVPGDDLGKRTFAGAVGTHDRVNFTGLHA